MDRDRDRDRDRERDRGERDRLERPSRPLERMDVTGANGRGSLASRSKDYGRGNYDEKKSAQNVCKHTASKPIKLEKWSLQQTLYKWT